MLVVLALLCLIVAVWLLVWLSIVDLRDWLLPNELVLGLAATGIVFHFLFFGAVLSPVGMLLGALTGGGALYLIRAVSNFIYKRDTMGLGDVKLLAAGGLWVGPYHIMIGLAAGALAGIVIGLVFLLLPHKHPEDIAPQEGDGLMKTSVPAGPGFAVGIAVAIGWMLYEWPWPGWRHRARERMGVMKYGLLSSADLSADDIQHFFARARAFKNGFRLSLKDKIVALIFLENSSRTRVSFEIAAKRLGIQTVFLGPDGSSLQKGRKRIGHGAHHGLQRRRRHRRAHGHGRAARRHGRHHAAPGHQRRRGRARPPVAGPARRLHLDGAPGRFERAHHRHRRRHRA